MLTTGAITNWAGNVTFAPARYHRPDSLDALRRAVAGARQVRVLGTGHSFNLIADTAGDLFRLDALPSVCEIDSTELTVEVGAGMRYAEVASRLHAAGFALGNLASLPHISVAGAVATGTHGSGDTQRGLAASVRAQRVIDPDGDLFELSQAETPEQIPGAVISLGTLGVVVSLTLEVEPAYEVAQWVRAGLALDRLGDSFEEIFTAAYSVSVFTDWRGDARVWLKHRTDRENAGPVAAGWLGTRPAGSPQHPVPGMPPAYCTDQSGRPGPWHERLPHFRPEFTPSRGEELQSEILLPRASAPRAVAALRRLAERIAPVLQISEVRTVARDDQWLSLSHGADAVAFHFTWLSDPATVLPVLAAVEAELSPLGGRPHWGKLTTQVPASLPARFRRSADFERLMRACDPAGKFRNPFVQALWPAPEFSPT